MALRKPRGPYPYVPGSSLECLAGARQTWDRLLADLAAAEERLLVENYIYEDGRAGEAVTDALLAAAGRGVDVRLLLDALGSAKLGSRTVARLREAGVRVRFFNPVKLKRLFQGRLGRLLRRTHRRIVWVDGRVGWVGGLAFADLWWPDEAGGRTRETMLRFEGPALQHLREAFFRLWDWPPRPRWSKPLAEAALGEVRLVTQFARRSPWFRRALRVRLRATRRRAWIATPYFIPPVGLRHNLRTARKRGADVRLLLPGSKIDHSAVRFAGRRYYGGLLRAGVRIWEYQERFLHAKTALFDDEWSLVGSPNLDRWSMFKNHELALESRDAGLAAQLEQQFEQDLAASREITLEEWEQRPAWDRFREHFFGIFDNHF